MPDRYDFSYQSPKQKGVLISLKLLVAGFTLLSLHSLGWNSESFDEKIVSIGGVFTGFWICANLLRVKLEVQELFIPPFNILHAKQFLIAGLLISFYSMYRTVSNIIELS